jgi:hypothetical protein
MSCNIGTSSRVDRTRTRSRCHTVTTPHQRGFAPRTRSCHQSAATPPHSGDQNGVVDVVSGGVITVEMCLGGRELTEPQLSPDGRLVAFVVRWGASAAIVTVPVAGGPERLVTTEPPAAPGRGFGGGCFAWLPDAVRRSCTPARDGDLWLQPIPGGPARRLSEVGEGRRAEAPAVDAGRGVGRAVVDQAEVWRWWLDGATSTAAPRRRSRPTSSSIRVRFREDHGTGWMAGMERARTCRGIAAVPAFATTSDVRDGAYQAQARSSSRAPPDGTGLCVRDDTGWNNVWLGDEPLVDEPFEHAGPTWGTGQRSFAVSPDGDRGRVHAQRARLRPAVRRRRGDPCGDRRRTRCARPAQLGRGPRRGAPERVPGPRPRSSPTTRRRGTDGAGRRSGGRLGGSRPPEPELVEVDAGRRDVHARRYVAGTGRTMCWVHGGPTDQWQVEFLPRRVLVVAGVRRPRPRSTRLDRPRARLPAGAPGRVGTPRRRRHRRLAESHRRGWSTPARTVVIGSSSGGLAVLGVVGRHDGLAAGGVVLYPVTDLAVLTEESHRFEAHYPLRLVGPTRRRRHLPRAVADLVRRPHRCPAARHAR